MESCEGAQWLKYEAGLSRGSKQVEGVCSRRHCHCFPAFHPCSPSKPAEEHTLATLVECNHKSASVELRGLRKGRQRGIAVSQCWVPSREAMRLRFPVHLLAVPYLWISKCTSVLLFKLFLVNKLMEFAFMILFTFPVILGIPKTKATFC